WGPIARGRSRRPHGHRGRIGYRTAEVLFPQPGEAVHNSSRNAIAIASPQGTETGPRRCPMKPIRLDAQQRHELQRRRHETHDKRLYERLSAVLWVGEGKTRSEVADLLGRSVRQLAEWLRLFRNRGLDALCALHHRGDPGNLSPAQVERLR